MSQEPGEEMRTPEDLPEMRRWPGPGWATRRRKRPHPAAALRARSSSAWSKADAIRSTSARPTPNRCASAHHLSALAATSATISRAEERAGP